MRHTEPKRSSLYDRMPTTDAPRKVERFYPVPDFIVEFFGILVPGFAFTTGLFPTLLFPVLALVFVLPQSGEGSGNLLPNVAIKEIFDVFKIEILISVVAFSYVWGHVFYRLNPKLPDTISYWSLSKEHRKSDPAGSCHKRPAVTSPKRFWHHLWEAICVSRLYNTIADQRNKKKKKRYPCIIEFPYRELGKWFCAKGLDEFAGYVTWSEEDGCRGTKHLLNVMKIVLEFTFPEQYARVARNEAHVRLVSSLWYASCYLIFLSVFGLVASVAANLLPFVFVVPHSFICLLVLLMQLIALGGLVRIKSSIEQSLHYMRIREIVFVFAEFHCASQIAPEIIDLLPRAPREPEEDGICEFP